MTKRTADELYFHDKEGCLLYYASTMQVCLGVAWQVLSHDFSCSSALEADLEGDSLLKDLFQFLSCLSLFQEHRPFSHHVLHRRRRLDS